MVTPTWLIAGDRDPIAPPELLECFAAWPRVTITVWPGWDHDLLLTEPQRCLEVVVSAAAATCALQAQ